MVYSSLPGIKDIKRKSWNPNNSRAWLIREVAPNLMFIKTFSMSQGVDKVGKCWLWQSGKCNKTDFMIVTQTLIIFTPVLPIQSFSINSIFFSYRISGITEKIRNEESDGNLTVTDVTEHLLPSFREMDLPRCHLQPRYVLLTDLCMLHSQSLKR